MDQSKVTIMKQGLKVLHLRWSGRIGGAENFSFLLAKAQNEQHNVTLGYLAQGSTFGAEARKCGINVVEFGMKSEIDIIRAKKVIDYIRKNSFDIIHDHNYPSFSSFVPLFLTKPIYVSHVHMADPTLTNLKRPAFFIYNKLVAKRVDHYFVISNFQKRKLEEKWKLDLSKTATVYNAIDLVSFRPVVDPGEIKRQLGIDRNSPVVGVVARLVRQKGIDHFLEIARIVVEKEAAVRFVIVGDGKMRRQLEEKSDILELGDRVRFTGARRDVANMISIFDIFCLTSNWEPFGITLVEAMSVGIPIVAFRVGGVPEVVSEKCGTLVEPKNYGEMAEAINRLIQNKKKRAIMGREGINRVQRMFDIRKIAEQIDGIYYDLVRRKRLRAVFRFR